MSALAAGYDYIQISLNDRAVSKESAEIRRGFEEIRQRQSRTSTFGQLQRLKDEAIDVQSRCAFGDWDGYGANGVSKEALAAALNFARLLPDGIPEPEIVPEPSGHLGFLWSSNPNKTYSVTASPDGQLVYAGVFGRKEISGQVPFYDELPQEIILALKEVS